MSIEIISQLETKIQQTIDTIGLLQMEVDELKEQKEDLEQKLTTSSDTMLTLQEENQRLKSEQSTWHGRLQELLAQINAIK